MNWEATGALDADHGRGTTKAGCLEVRLIEPEMAMCWWRVEDPTGSLSPFNVLREGDTLIYAGGGERPCTVDLQSVITEEEWMDEFGGLATYDELKEAIQ